MDCAGERQLQEWEVDWLPGYEGSKPVRIGNAAAMQVQLDIYGEMLDSFFHAQHKMGRHTEDDFRVLVLLLKHLETIWQDPDEGIWETRGGPQQFTYSKMMAWVAFDRAVLLAEQMNYKAPVDQMEGHQGRDSSADLREGIQRDEEQLCAGVRVGGTGCFAAADAAGRISARRRSARAEHGRGDSTRTDAGWIGASLRHIASERRIAAGRGSVSGVQLLDGEQPEGGGARRGGAQNCSSICCR